MEKEENVCVKTMGTEEKNVMENGAKGCCENASAVPAKFKDVDALARAYSALQSEFTRRSQRLKELERKVENLEGEGASVRSGAEKLRKNARVRRADAARFDRFVAETEKTNGQSTEDTESVESAVTVETAEGTETFHTAETEPATETVAMVATTANLNEKPTKEQPLENEALEEKKGGEGEKGPTTYEMNSSTDAPAHGGEGAEKQEQAEAGATVRSLKMQAQEGAGQASVAGNEAAFTPSEALYAQVCRDEGVRLRIIGEYLSSLGKSGAPLMTGGAGAFTAPPKKAANIAEAGNMALLYFKKPSQV